MRGKRVAESFVGAFLNDLVRQWGKRAFYYFAVGAVALLALAAHWWEQQTVFVRVLVVLALLGVLGLWVRHKLLHRARPKPVGAEPTQVLYRWWEPVDLDPGDRICYCGKERVPGELVYVGITGAHRSRELDDDRQASCWWRPGLVGTTETFMTRDAVERAERKAIRSEHPRENKQHARGAVWG